MNISKLVPQPTKCESFKRNRERYIPDKPGCYALATFSKEVLYVGLTVDLRKRMNNHLDDPTKTCETAKGRAVLFYWIESPEINKIERTWMNIHNLNEGTLPEFNTIYSPTPT